MKRVLRQCVLLGAAAMLSGCGASDRLAGIGQAPAMSAIEDPQTQPGYKPVSLPMPAPTPAAYAPNSLWRQGARTFFKDQRAVRVGDIMTVRVVIEDKAEFANTTSRSRAASDKAGIQGLPGALLKPLIPSSVTTDAVIGDSSNSAHVGSGSAKRSERLETNVAVVITQVLPNGNLVVEGRQEVRVNFELRELIVAGIVRPEDIAADNTIDSAKIAEARISYGGKGQITDVQQPRYGQQALDVILPF